MIFGFYSHSYHNSLLSFPSPLPPSPSRVRSCTHNPFWPSLLDSCFTDNLISLTSPNQPFITRLPSICPSCPSSRPVSCRIHFTHHLSSSPASFIAIVAVMSVAPYLQSVASWLPYPRCCLLYVLIPFLPDVRF